MPVDLTDRPPPNRRARPPCLQTRLFLAFLLRVQRVTEFGGGDGGLEHVRGRRMETSGWTGEIF